MLVLLLFLTLASLALSHLVTLDSDGAVTRARAQHAQLMQFQQIALAAEQRAEAAMRWNRYLIIGLATAAVVAALVRSPR